MRRRRSPYRHLELPGNTVPASRDGGEESPELGIAPKSANTGLPASSHREYLPTAQV